MNFSDKLKELRKSHKMSQEQLAEKLYVSRQAITKWETGNGLPDIENIVAIGALFNTSLDDLLSEEKNLLSKHEFLYESRTEYDLDEEKFLDIQINSAHEVIVEKTTEEKIQIVLASNKLINIKQKLKVKITDNKKYNKKYMDIDVKHSSDLTDIQLMEELFIFIKIPQRFVTKTEISGNLNILRIRDITFENLEFNGKVKEGYLTNCSGHVELDTSSDVVFTTDTFKGKVDFNQFHANSILNVENGNCYLRRIGSRNHFVDTNGKIIEVAKSGRKDDIDSTELNGYDFIVEIAGWKSELKIVK